MQKASGAWLAAGALLLTAAACDASSNANDTGIASRGPGAAPTTPDGAHAAGSGAANSGALPATPPTQATAGAGAIADLPPEMEATVDLQLPQASDNFVYAVNPDAGTVAVIDARTQSVQTIKTGNRPTYLRTLEGTDNAIVLNVGSNKASIIRNKSNGATKSDLAVSAGSNAIAVAPDGKHAVVYYNSTYQSAGASAGSYQDAAVLSLSDDGASDSVVSMTVGFRPRDVAFSSDGSRAFVVTEDGVSVLDFADVEKNGPGIARLVSFGGSVDQKNADVAITPDGKYALARVEGQSVLHLADLDSPNVRSLDVSGVYASLTPDADGGDDSGADAGVAPVPVAITDLDLLPDGKSALATLRNQSAVLRIPLPDAFDDMSKVSIIRVPDQVIGSLTVAPNGSYALGYTTAVDLERLVILDLSKDHPAQPRAVALRKTVHAVTFTPDSETALITHEKAPGSPTDPGLTPDQVIDRSYGYSLLRVRTGDVKLQATRTQLGPIAMVPDGSFLFILFRDDPQMIKEVQRVALASFLVDPIIQLENPPISIGTARASGSVFVNLDYPDGRMTFIDWENPTQKTKTVTGFELNSRIRD